MGWDGSWHGMGRTREERDHVNMVLAYPYWMRHSGLARGSLEQDPTMMEDWG